jgi:hypothetical protein
MDRQRLLEELAQAIADRNYAYKHSLEIIQAAKTARKVHRYHKYGHAAVLVVTVTVYTMADAEAAALLSHVKDIFCMGWHWIYSA